MERGRPGRPGPERSRCDRSPCLHNSGLRGASLTGVGSPGAGQIKESAHTRAAAPQRQGAQRCKVTMGGTQVVVMQCGQKRQESRPESIKEE